MATWKKVIVSGSSAELLTVTASFYKGDGSALTGVTATAVFPTSQTTSILSTTKLFSNDGGNTFVYVGQVTGSTYAGVSGDITIGTGGVAAIGSGKVNSTMIVDGTITGTDIASATVANSNLVNSSITIGSTSTALGASNTTIAGLTSVTSTGFTGALTGNASTATTLATARTINGTSFNGSADITVTAAAGTLSGATLASNVLASSLTSVGTLAGVTVTGTAALSTVTVANNLTISGDLYVNGTTTAVNTSNLFVSDKFITLSSGSAASGDSGIIIDRGSDSAGNVAFGFDTATTRFGFQNGLSNATNAIDTTASSGVSGSFIAHVFTEAAHGATKPITGEFAVAGAIYTNTDGNVWIYS